MDHKAWLAGIPPEVRRALTARSDRAGLAHLAGHLGAIGVTSALILSGVPGWGLAVPVQGVLVVFLFTLQHECTHRTPFASDRLNDLVGRVLALPLVQPFLWFRAFHLARHRHTNLPGKDPELDGPGIATRGQWLWHVSGLPLWRANVATVIRLARGRADDPFLPAGMKASAIAEARVMLVVYAALLMSLIWSSAVLWLWLIPVLLGQPFLRLYLLAEHGDCPRVADMLDNTRTTLTGPLVRFLAWNMPYHTEHHVWPQVPFHHLPAVHGHLAAHLRHTSDGYAAFTRDYLHRRRPGRRPDPPKAPPAR